MSWTRPVETCVARLSSSQGLVQKTCWLWTERVLKGHACKLARTTCPAKPWSRLACVSRKVHEPSQKMFVSSRRSFWSVSCLCRDMAKRPFLHDLAYPVSGQGHFSCRKDLSPKHVQPNITFTKASVPCVLARQTKAITKAMDKPCSRTGQQDNTQRPSAKAFWLDMLSGQQAFSFKSDLDPFWQEPLYLSSQKDSRDGNSTVEMPVLGNLRNSSWPVCKEMTCFDVLEEGHFVAWLKDLKQHGRKWRNGHAFKNSRRDIGSLSPSWTGLAKKTRRWTRSLQGKKAL